MSQITQNGAISTPKKELVRGVVIAAIVAGVILMVAVLPSEYGIDPTGAGNMLGLTGMHNTAAATVATVVAPVPKSTAPDVMVQAEVPAASTTIPVRKASTVAAPGEERTVTIASAQTAAYRVDTVEITLPPGKGLEVKTNLAKGAPLIYSWKTKGGEVLNHDFHGEPVNAKHDEFESFILEDNVSESRGSLIAPFTGIHGWYWKNKSKAAVTVVLNASGFYTGIFKK